MSDLLEIGSAAPSFSAVANDGNTISLDELLKNGPVALFFYPADNTPGCNRQLSTVRDEMTRFADAGVQPLGVNPGSVATHAKYAAKMEFGFPLLSDADRSIAGAYHAIKLGGLGIQRTVYGIDRDGRIAFAVRGAPPPAEVIAAVTE
jgi:peroxiredoxin Q/BCP